MLRNDTTPNKTGASYDDKQATVELTDGRTIEAAHHFLNEDNSLLHLCVHERDGGIDVTIPLNDSHARAWARSDEGREALGIDREDAQDDARDAHDDGGAQDVVEGDDVEWEGKEWCVQWTDGDELTIARPDELSYKTVQRSDVTLTDDDGIEEGDIVVVGDESGPLGDERWEVIDQIDQSPSDIKIQSLETGGILVGDASYVRPVTDDESAGDGIDRGRGIETDGGRDFATDRYGIGTRIGRTVRVAEHEDDVDIDVDHDRGWILAELGEFGGNEARIAREDGTVLDVTLDDIAADVIEPGEDLDDPEFAWPFDYGDDADDGVDRGDGVRADGGRQDTRLPPVGGIPAQIYDAGEIEEGELVLQNRDRVAATVRSVEDDRVVLDVKDGMAWYVRKGAAYVRDDDAYVWFADDERTPAPLFRCEYCEHLVLCCENHQKCHKGDRDDSIDRGDGPVTDGGRATHDVVYCNCGRGMSVPFTENEPEDGWTCGTCKRQSEWKKHSHESREIRDNTDVEVGDRAVYDGAIWTFDDWGPWHCVELKAVDGSIARGIDVRDLDPVPEDCELPLAEPRYDVREEYTDDERDDDVDRGRGVRTDGGIDAGDGDDEDLADIDPTDLDGVEIPGSNPDAEPGDDGEDGDGDAPEVNTGDMDDTVEFGDGSNGADMFEALNRYSDEEIANAVDCSEILIDTYVDKRYTTNTPGDGDEPDSDVPHDAQDLKWLAGNIDPRKQIDVHVRVLDVRERDGGSADVLVADGTAAVEIEVPARIRPEDSMGPVAEFDAGDVVVFEAVETREPREAANEHYCELRYGIDTDVTVIDAWDRPDAVPVGVTVDEKSRLVNDCERYNYEEKPAARGRVVETIVEEFHVKHIMDSEETWTWVGETAWAPRGDDRIESRLGEYLPDEVNTRTERAEILARVELAAQTDENPFTPDPPDGSDLKWKTPVLNGLIDMREGPDQEVEPHAPEHHTTLAEVLNVEHDPDADCPDISDNLDKIARDDIMRATIEEMMANILMRNNDYRKAYVCYGDEKTGKSFIDNLLKWLIGDDGIEHMRFTRFIGSDDFEDDAARHSYAVLDDDSSGKSISVDECAAFKRFVGSGGTRTGAKDVQRESYDPYATIKLNLNELPVWKAWDGSIQSRILPIFFTQQFVASPDPDADDEHQSVKESELERELRTDAELAGLLNVVIEAANRLFDTDEWSVYERYYDDLPENDPGEAHDLLLEKYQNYADTTRRFARKFMTEADEAVEVRKDDWYELYRRWCDEQGVDPQSKSRFWQQIGDDDTVYVEEKQPYQSKRVTLYVAPTSKVLDYAPAPVKDRIEDLVETAGFNVGIDETTPITDLPRGSDYATVEGEVVTVTMEEDPRDGELKAAAVIEDDSGGRVTLLSPSDESIASGMIDDELGESFDEIVPGSTVRVHSGITLRNGPYMRAQDGASSIDIVNQPDGAGESGTALSDDRTDEGDEDGDDGMDSREQMLHHIWARETDEEGAQIDDVLAAAERTDIQSPQQTLERLKHDGTVYESASDRVKTTDGSNGGEA